MEFGDRLRQARIAKGLSQQELGRGLGTDGKDCTKAVVSGWEGNKHFPRADQLALICMKLDSSADHLLLGRQHADSLLPEVSEVAVTINSLPQRQREWVIRTTKDAVKLAIDTLTAAPNGVTPKESDGRESHDAGSPRSRKLA